MEELVRSGRIAEIIVALTALELVGLWLARRAGWRVPDPGRLLWTALAGVGLALALRAALIGGTWLEIAAWLAASLACHLADLAARRRRGE